MTNNALYKTLGTEVVEEINAEIQRLGGDKILFAGMYGSRIKGYHNLLSDFDIYVVYRYNRVAVQQLMFKTQEYFDRTVKSGEEHAFDITRNGNKYQIKAVSIHHFIAQVCASNYDMVTTVMNSVYCEESSYALWSAMKLFAKHALDNVTVMQSKYRASYSMARSLREAEDRKGTGNRQDRRIAESPSRLLDAAHAYMTAEIIRQDPPFDSFYTCDFTSVIDEYSKLPIQRVLNVRFSELLELRRANEDKEAIYSFVHTHIVPGILASRPDFDTHRSSKNERILSIRKDLSAVIYRESLTVCLSSQK